MKTSDIYLVNPYQVVDKLGAVNDAKLVRSESFMNFGLLSLLRFIRNSGLDAEILDLSINKNADELLSRMSSDREIIIGVSVISAFTAASSADILRKVRQVNPNALIVIGGQHYVGLLGERAFDLFPEADVLVSCEGEFAMLAIAQEWAQYRRDFTKWSMNILPSNVSLRLNQHVVRGTSDVTMLDLDELAGLACSGYPTAGEVFPAIEYSRGCKFSCHFCANTDENRQHFRARSAMSLGASVTKLLDEFSHRPLRFYLEASNFVIQADELGGFITALNPNNQQIEWRVEMRISDYGEAYFRKLHAAGLRIIDLGLESASLSTLKCMAKTRNSAQYLRAASNMLKAAHAAGIFMKVNFLVCPGDTHESLNESWLWFKEHASFIDGVSAGVALLLPGTYLKDNIKHYEEQFGTRVMACADLSAWGVDRLIPSESLSLEEAEAFCLKLARLLNTRAKYAYAKSFGYYGCLVDWTKVRDDLPSGDLDRRLPYLA
jgi:radical SAM superfamily enzyme YgiQ (UPF0313 family)